jgi:hypothetical protein
MGLSGVNGKVYYANDGCPVINQDGTWAGPSTEVGQWTDEVTKFGVVDSVESREYGHDKSGGWKDAVAGTRSLAISIDAVISANEGRLGVGGMENMWAGRVVYLELYPFGVFHSCGQYPAAGWALCKQVSYSYDVDTGQPTSYSASFVSKGPWDGAGGENQWWGGFECSPCG